MVLTQDKQSIIDEFEGLIFEEKDTEDKAIFALEYLKYAVKCGPGYKYMMIPDAIQVVASSAHLQSRYNGELEKVIEKAEALTMQPILQ